MMDFVFGLAVSTAGSDGTYESLQSSFSSAALEAILVARRDMGADNDVRLRSVLVFGSLNAESRLGIMSGECSGVKWLRASDGNRPRALGDDEKWISS